MKEQELESRLSGGTTMVEMVEKYPQILEVIAERWRQNRIHPNFPEDRSMQLAIIVEEVGEVAQAMNDENSANWRDELIQVAASALRAVEAFDESGESDMRGLAE